VYGPIHSACAAAILSVLTLWILSFVFEHDAFFVAILAGGLGAWSYDGVRYLCNVYTARPATLWVFPGQEIQAAARNQRTAVEPIPTGGLVSVGMSLQGRFLAMLRRGHYPIEFLHTPQHFELQIPVGRPRRRRGGRA
jgi:hypothetical protein